MKITKRQLRRIIKEPMEDEPIRMIPGDSFPADALKSRRSRKPQPSGEFRDTIVMSPTGDTLLVGWQEVALQNVVRELEVQTGQSIPIQTAGDINAKLLKQHGQGYVELPISWSPDAGWKF